MAAEWYYRVEEGGHHSDYGPISADMLKQLAAFGAVKPGMLIRKGADGKWCKAESVRGLFPEESPRNASGGVSPPKERAVSSPPSPVSDCQYEESSTAFPIWLRVFCGAAGGLVTILMFVAFLGNGTGTNDDETETSGPSKSASSAASVPTPTSKPTPSKSTPSTPTYEPTYKPKPSGTVVSSYLRGELPGVKVYSGWDWTGNLAHATVGYDGDDWNAYVSVNAAGTQLTGYRLKHIHVADVLFPQYAPYVPKER